MYTLKEHENKNLFNPNDISETLVITSKVKEDDVKTLNESAQGKSNRKLIVKMEAIHQGKTKNSTFYTEEGLKAGIQSWTHPYEKPVLTHHNSYDGEPIGRIIEAEYSNNTVSGRGGLIFTVEITDPNAIEKVLDGRYKTVSIGASTDKVTCNICGTNRTEEWCNHYPGRSYDEQQCHFIIGTTFGREVSYVNTPADEDAGNISVEMSDKTHSGGSSESEDGTDLKIFQVSEGLYQDASQPSVNLYEHLNEDQKEIFNTMATFAEGSKKQMDPQNEDKDTAEKQTVENNNEEPNQTNKNESIEANQATSNKEESLTENERQNFNDKISKLQESVSNLVLQTQKLETKNDSLEKENQRLLSENASLLESEHKTLAEKVVDLKISLRKVDVIGKTKEAAFNDHIKRTSASLTDSLNDLLAEAKTAESVEPNSVSNPGVAVDESNEKSKLLSVEEGVSTMMKFFSKK